MAANWSLLTLETLGFTHDPRVFEHHPENEWETSWDLRRFISQMIIYEDMAGEVPEMVSSATWLAGKSPNKWRFLARKVSYEWCMFHCHV